MANNTLTADVIAKIALPILENELGCLNYMYRAHEDEFSSTVNGYKKGDTISIRRPADFTVRSGATMSINNFVTSLIAGDASDPAVPLAVGGTLNVGTLQASGTYTGNIFVTVTFQ